MTRRELIDSVRRQYLYLEHPLPDLEEWPIDQLQKALAQNADAIWELQGEQLVRSVANASWL